MALPTAKAEGHRVQVAEELIDFVHNFFKEMKRINEENKIIKAHNRITNEKEHKELLIAARSIRHEIIDTTMKAGGAHIGGGMSAL